MRNEETANEKIHYEKLCNSYSSIPLEIKARKEIFKDPDT
jgi:hypothetical protein